MGSCASDIPEGWTQEQVDYAMETLIPCLIELKRKARERIAAKKAAEDKGALPESPTGAGESAS